MSEIVKIEADSAGLQKFTRTDDGILIPHVVIEGNSVESAGGSNSDGIIVNGSAQRYQVVNLTSTDYIPTENFIGIHVLSDGDVKIEGVDGNAVTIPLVVGLWPYGGSKILRTGTSATLIALF